MVALDKWVAWSLDAGLLRQAPFRYVDKTVMTPASPRWVRVNAEVESDPLDDPLRFASSEDYLLWRNVGLRGELPEGGADPAWWGRHGECNALFADGLIHSGTSPDPVWDLGPSLPCSTSQRTIVFTSVADPITALVLREYSGS
ncbi:hypothetical protein ACWDV7_03095 [Streptomyces sp. NPDC003362]